METVPFTSLLSKIVDNRGRTCPTADAGLPLIATNCVKNSTLYPVFEKVRFVSPETYNTWFRGHPQPGDLVFVCKGAPGQVCLTPDPVSFCIAQDMVALRPDPARVYPPYLFAALRAAETQNRINNMHVGSLIPHFKKGDFDKLSIPLPSRVSQEFIGDWHMAIEQMIELNRRTNETLEAMAQAIFRDWFVDFGPTCRKQAGATDPIEIMGGLTPDPTRAAELAVLFPDEFDAGDFPAGWRRSNLSELATVNDESWKAGNHPDTVDYIDLSNTKWGVIESTARLSWVEAPTRARRITRPLDTIVATVRPGNGSYTFISEGGYTASTGFAVLRPRRSEYADALYVAVTRPETIQSLANLADAHAGAYPSINPEDVMATQFSASNSDLLVAFGRCVRPIREGIEHAKGENRTLAETRDYLLPRLMSGAVQVGDVTPEIAP
jgi:type I restriction enzyme S subunit